MGGASSIPLTEELEKVIDSESEEHEFKVGQKFYLENCGHTGRIIRVYENGDIAVRCSESHENDPITGDVYKGKFKTPLKSSFGFRHTSKILPRSKSNLVYIIGTR